MRAAVSCALVLLAASVLSAAASMPARCGTANDYPADAARPKPSALAPHPGAHSRVYGAPIQPRIFTSHPKKKPQLKSAPLPDA